MRVPEAGGLTSKREYEKKIMDHILGLGLGGSSGRKTQLNH